jgi:hypothetical protein
MVAVATCRKTVLDSLRNFLESTGRRGVTFDDGTHLLRDLGLSSDEGVDFVLDLCDALEFDFPKDFNPFVRPDGRGGRRVGEMIDAIEVLLTREVNE